MIHCVFSLKHVSLGLRYNNRPLQMKAVLRLAELLVGHEWTTLVIYGQRIPLPRQGVKIFYCLIAIFLNWPIFLPILQLIFHFHRHYRPPVFTADCAVLAQTDGERS